MMLDDLKYVHEKDPDGAFDVAAKEAAQLRDQHTIIGNAQFKNVYNIVHAGMGGSALPALLAKTWPVLSEPFEIVRNYDIPAYVDQDTLFIADSYSGNTEETISALEQAAERGAQIAVIAGGGKLEQIATEKDYPFIKLPKVEQPRYATFTNYRALITFLVAAGVVQADDVYPTLDRAAEYVERAIQRWLPTVPTKDNPAKQLAQELIGKSVVVYGGPKLFPAAYKWKISFNENAKQLAWTNELPEFNHNEFIGWSKQPVDKPYAVIDLRSNLEHPRVQKRFEVSARLLSGMRPEPHVVQAQGDDMLEQLLWTVAYGDFVTLYVAMLNGINPAPVDLVESFKKALDE
ncbi:MAG TPA: bifunctional phosphoglucose/phosphomannose isomerase [Candidatus Saccharimonadales bacterium]|nr:bifunctional phosphoglucose/phosphomannose isomerase [Candidatus Saccharimonadales bacterium]